MDDGQRQYLTISGYLDSAQLNFRPFYIGCPECKKKLTSEVCPTHGSVTPVCYWNLRMSLVDYSGDGEVSFFGDTAKDLTGIDAQTMKEMWDSQNDDAGMGEGDAAPEKVLDLFARLRFKRCVIRVSVSARQLSSDATKTIQSIQAFHVYPFDPIMEAQAVRSDIERLKKQAAAQ